jgi:Fusaric acid resistance protein family
MSATFVEARSTDSDWIGWLKRELAPSHDRAVRTAILVCGTVLCVIISMTLQVPELAVSAYMVFFFSKQNKAITTMVGILGFVGVTIAVGISLLLYKITYGHPELRIPAMAVVLFGGMYLSRILTIGPLGFILGFVIAVSQSVGELIPSPELVVRALLWLWVAISYGVGITVALYLLFGPRPSGLAPKPKGFFVPDAFTNPAHVHFALKVTFAAMFCYIFYSAIDWSGIHTAFITCCFIALESTEATVYKGMLRIVGCIIGGAIALFSTIFLIPHMETIASLIVLVAAVSAIAGWVATGSERISYAGLQIAFAFFLSTFQGYAPDTDLDKIRDRVVGILLGIAVTGLIFNYVWQERERIELPGPK